MCTISFQSANPIFGEKTASYLIFQAVFHGCPQKVEFKNSEILTLFTLWLTFEAFPEAEILHKVVECTSELNEQLLKISKNFASDFNSVGLPQL